MVKHFRDCKAWKEENLAMSTTNDESAKLFDNIIHQYVTWIHSIVSTEWRFGRHNENVT